MTREALFLLRPGASGLLRADRTYIWVPKAGDIDIDLVDHEGRAPVGAGHQPRTTTRPRTVGGGV